MKNAYTPIRKIHQFAALVLASYLAMYALTGLVLIYPSVVPDRWSVAQNSSRSVEIAGLPTTLETTELKGEALSNVTRLLTGQLDIRGRLETIDHAGSVWSLTFQRPGTVERVRWTPGNPVVSLEISSGNIRGMLNRLHHLDGYRGGPRFWVWAALLDLVSLSMFLFAGSGIYLWYIRKQKDRRLGWVILGGSTFFVLSSVTYLLLAK